MLQSDDSAGHTIKEELDEEAFNDWIDVLFADIWNIWIYCSRNIRSQISNFQKPASCRETNWDNHAMAQSSSCWVLSSQRLEFALSCLELG